MIYWVTTQAHKLRSPLQYCWRRLGEIEFINCIEVIRKDVLAPSSDSVQYTIPKKLINTSTQNNALKNIVSFLSK